MKNGIYCIHIMTKNITIDSIRVVCNTFARTTAEPLALSFLKFYWHFIIDKVSSLNINFAFL